MALTVTPAYGRDYKSAKAAIVDWQAGNDFVICCFGHPGDGRYINKAQADDEGASVRIRYKKLTQITEALAPNPKENS